MRASIRFKFFVAVLAVAISFITLISILNIFFYDDYYRIDQQRVLRTLYRDTVTAYDGTLPSIAVPLITAEESQGVRLTLVRADGTILYDTSLRQLSSESGSIRPYLFGNHWKPETFFSDLSLIARALQTADAARLEAEGYDLFSVQFNGSDYLYLVGQLDEDFLIVRLAIAYVETNSSFNSTFLLIAGLLSLLICLIPAYWIARRFSKPLIEMSEAAHAMARLDFSQQVKTNSADEIGQLGQSLNLLSQHLERAVHELQQSNAALEQENREKERIDLLRREFLINVSHELKTPIALIRGYAEGLREGIAENPEDRQYYCDTICEEAMRMNELVLQLLHLSKLEDGRDEVNLVPVDLSVLCTAEVEKVSPLAAERQLHLVVDVPPQTVCTDEDLVSRILSNYLSNAIRYTPTGGTICLSAAPAPDGQTVVRVFNEGEGVAPEELERLWDKFYRTDKARSRESGGTGIGLSIVRAAAEVLGASVWVQNEPGGIAFYLALPASCL